MHQKPLRPTFSSEGRANVRGISSLESSLPHEEEERGSLPHTPTIASSDSEMAKETGGAAAKATSPPAEQTPYPQDTFSN